jgi:hypothetical protein
MDTRTKIAAMRRQTFGAVVVICVQAGLGMYLPCTAKDAEDTLST